MIAILFRSAACAVVLFTALASATEQPPLEWIDDPQLSAGVSASGHRVQVEQLPDQRLALQAWRGVSDGGEMGRGLVRLRALSPLWLAVDAVSVQSAHRAPWNFGPLRAMDARLQWAWIGSAAGGEAVPWTGDGTFPADAVVLELWCRHEVGGGNGFTALANGDFSAIIAVPAGMALSQARKQPELVLATLPMLKEFSPGPEAPALRFELGAAGAWRLAMDLDRNGEADIVIADDSPGCQAHALPGLAGERSLWLGMLPSGGIRQGQVGLSTMTLWYQADDRDLPAEQRQRRPLCMEVPEASLVSPWRGELRRWRPTMDLSASPGLRLSQLDPLRFHLEVALDPQAATPLWVEQQGDPPNRRQAELRWQACDPLSQAPPTRLLRGDALLLQPSVVMQLTAPNGATHTLSAGQAQVQTFDQLGSWQLRAGDQSWSVLVQATDLPEVLPAQQSGRLLAVRSAPGIDAQRLEVSVDGGASAEWLSGGDAQVALLRIAGPAGEHRLRLSLDGEVVAESSLRIFTLQLRGGGGVSKIDDPAVNFSLVMTPYVEGVPIRFTTIDRSCTFLGGALAFTVVSGGGPSDHGEPAMREEGGQGFFDYRMRIPGGSWAHRYDAQLDALDPARRPLRSHGPGATDQPTSGVDDFPF